MSGLRIYDVYRDPINERFYNQKLEPVPPPLLSNFMDMQFHVHPYEEGVLSLHSGQELHSIPPPANGLQAGDMRVTIQGWGQWVPGEGWLLFA